MSNDGIKIAHYTSVEALYSIFNDCSDRKITLRLGNIHYMNDTQEAVVGEYCVERLVKQFESETDDKEVKRYLKEYQDTKLSQTSRFDVFSDLKPIFLISFTKFKEDGETTLLHWRAYGDDACGVCIVFNYDKLKQEVGDSGKVSRLNEVSYISPLDDNMEKQELSEEIQNSINDICKKKLPNFLLQTKDSSLIPSYLNGTLAFYKHYAFKSEQEYRLMIATTEMVGENIGYHSKNKDILPHYEIKISIECIDQIIIGPVSKLKKFTLENFLQSKGISNNENKITESSVPNPMESPNPNSQESDCGEHRIEIKVADLPYIPNS